MIVFENGRERKNREILDCFVFAVLTLMLPLFSIGKFIESENPDLPFGIDPFQPTNLPIIIPIVVVFLLLAFFFIWRRTPYLERTKKRNFVLILFAIFFFSCLSGTLLFPKGETDFTFTSDIYGMTATVSYDYPMTVRIISLIEDFCFGFYFVLLFGYTDTLGKKFTILVDIALFCLIVIAFLAFAYSMVMERDIVINNFYALLEKEGYSMRALESFTGHKNTYGFLMTLSCFACFIFFARKPNPVLPLVVLFCFFNTLLCGSRTAIYLCSAGIIAYCILFPFIAFRTNRISSFFFIAIDVALLAFLVYAFTRPEGHPIHVFFDGFLENMTDLVTINMRMEHWETALAMMNNGFFQLFGYGKFPFLNLYHQFEIAIGGEYSVVTSHNGFLQPYLEFGLIGAVCTLLLTLYIAYMVLRLLIGQKNQKIAFSHLLVSVLTLIHCYIEPRFFLMNEGSNILLMFACLFPLMREYRDSILKPRHCC